MTLRTTFCAVGLFIGAGFSLPAPIAYWDFQDGAGTQVTDRSGNGRHGTISGTATWGGIGGTALYFNGATTVSVPYNAAFNLNEFTLVAWVKTDVRSPNQYCLISRQPVAGYPFNYRLNIVGQAINSAYGLPLGGAWVDYWDNVTSTYAAGRTIVDNGTWHQIVGTYRNLELRVYIDGRLDTNRSQPLGPTLTSLEPIILGGTRFPGNNSLRGWMDEARIYDVALNAAQVDSLYTAFMPPVIPPPPAPILSSPANGAVNQPPSLTLYWNAVTGATSYGLQVADDSAFTTGLLNYTGITTTSRAVSGLGAGIHYWRANATNANGTSAWSLVRNFTVSPPAAPILSSPANGATGQPSSLTLSWLSVTGATSYGLQVGIDSTFTVILLNYTALTITSQAISGLISGTRYYWRANAANSAGTSPWSAARNFTVGPPAAPILSSPANGATGLFSSLTLVWSASTGASSYGLQVAFDSAFASPAINSTGLTATSRAVNLSNGTRYYWRANAANALGTGPWSAIRNFTTSSPPAVPDLVAYWDFEERSGVQVLDKSGNNHHGTIQGAVLWGGTGGTALAFNGSTKVTVPYDSLLSLDRFTLMAWVRPQNTLNSQCLVCRQPAGGTPWNYRLFITGQDAISLAPLQTPVVDYWDGSAANSTTHSLGATTVSLNNWHQLVGTYQNRELRVYLDGRLGDSSVALPAGPVWTSIEPIVLGGSNYSSNPYYLFGWLDEVRIYSVVMSPAQIDSAFNAFTPPVVSPVGIRNARNRDGGMRLERRGNAAFALTGLGKGAAEVGAFTVAGKKIAVWKGVREGQVLELGKNFAYGTPGTVLIKISNNGDISWKKLAVMGP